MDIQHSSRTDNWSTPESIVEMIHEVIGIPDLDPASSKINNRYINAKRIITAQENGLVSRWVFDSTPITVFVNPPGGKIGNKSITKMFWQRLMEYRNTESINEAIFMFFSVEGLQNTQSLPHPATDFPLCIPSKRIKFESECGLKKQPSHSNAIVYVPGLVNNTSKFYQVFRELGAIMVPYN